MARAGASRDTGCPAHGNLQLKHQRGHVLTSKRNYSPASPAQPGTHQQTPTPGYGMSMKTMGLVAASGTLFIGGIAHIIRRLLPYDHDTNRPLQPAPATKPAWPTAGVAFR